MKTIRSVRVVDFASVAELDGKWTKIVGAQIAAVTHPRSVSRDGVLLVGVATGAWAEELARIESLFGGQVQARIAGIPITRVRYQIVPPVKPRVHAGIASLATPLRLA